MKDKVKGFAMKTVETTEEVSSHREERELGRTKGHRSTVSQKKIDNQTGKKYLENPCDGKINAKWPATVNLTP